MRRTGTLSGKAGLRSMGASISFRRGEESPRRKYRHRGKKEDIRGKSSSGEKKRVQSPMPAWQRAARGNALCRGKGKKLEKRLSTKTSRSYHQRCERVERGKGPMGGVKRKHPESKKKNLEKNKGSSFGRKRSCHSKGGGPNRPRRL